MLNSLYDSFQKLFLMPICMSSRLEKRSWKVFFQQRVKKLFECADIPESVLKIPARALLPYGKI